MGAEAPSAAEPVPPISSSTHFLREHSRVIIA